MAESTDIFSVLVRKLDGEQITCRAFKGERLRDVLLRHEVSPYTRITRRFNCGGRGLCATCGVWILDGDSPAKHWHDHLACRFGYPRLSCQVMVDRPMKVELVEKWIWGGPKKESESKD